MSVVAGRRGVEEDGQQPNSPGAGVDADDVIARVREATTGRVDRVEAKLVRWEVYRRSGGPGPGNLGDRLDPERLVWVVVVGGELGVSHPRAGQDPGFGWGVSLVAADGPTLGSSASMSRRA